MQTDLIDTFLDLVETRSFNRSAERLGVTQSTISGRVKALEGLLGCRLFSRSRAGTQLTTEGLRFEPHARSLRHGWTEARNAVRDARDPALTLRVGIQHDLMGDRVAAWLGVIRAALPEAALYVEADYSVQMCADVQAGELDLAIAFTPRAHPDLHFATLGEMSYRMVSTETDQLSAVRPDSYILPNYSPAFARTHAALFPVLSGAPVSSGQTAVVDGMLRAFGGATFLPAQAAADRVAAGEAHAVRRAPPIRQPVFAVLHLRNRHRGPHRRIVRLLSDELARAERLAARAFPAHHR